MESLQDLFFTFAVAVLPAELLDMARSSRLPEVLDSTNTVAGEVACWWLSSAGLVPHLHLQREREVRFIRLENLHHGILRTFVVGRQRESLEAKLLGHCAGLGHC